MATTIYESVKNSLIALFRGRWPAFDVFCEDIDKTQEGGRTELEDYIYLDIIPAGNRTVESSGEYLKMAQELDGLLRPVFRFTDQGEARAVTVPDLSFKTVDKLLHCSFTLSFRDSIGEPEAPPFMEELETAVKTNERA